MDDRRGMNGYWFSTVVLVLGLLAALFGLAVRGEPLAIVALSVLATVSVMLVAFAVALAFERRQERTFRANAEENHQLMQQQARGLSDLALAQQRQMQALGAGQRLALPEPAAAEQGYQFGMAADVFAGFGDDDAPGWSAGG